MTLQCTFTVYLTELVSVSNFNNTNKQIHHSYNSVAGRLTCHQFKQVLTNM